MCVYMVARKEPIFFKIPVSILEVSSNPGVSMRITDLPLRANPSATWTSTVHASNPIPIGRFESLARLINWKRVG